MKRLACRLNQLTVTAKRLVQAVQQLVQSFGVGV
jgi:hypothetical protein